MKLINDTPVAFTAQQLRCLDDNGRQSKSVVDVTEDDVDGAMGHRSPFVLGSGDGRLDTNPVADAYLR